MKLLHPPPPPPPPPARAAGKDCTATRSPWPRHRSVSYTHTCASLSVYSSRWSWSDTWRGSFWSAMASSSCWTRWRKDSQSWLSVHQKWSCKKRCVWISTTSWQRLRYVEDDNFFVLFRWALCDLVWTSNTFFFLSVVKGNQVVRNLLALTASNLARQTNWTGFPFHRTETCFACSGNHWRPAGSTMVLYNRIRSCRLMYDFFFLYMALLHTCSLYKFRYCFSSWSDKAMM